MTAIGVRILCLLIGYCAGMVQSAYLIGKMKGLDIREHGSGNAGTTNALRVMGKKAGLLVFVFDIVKCILAILLVTALLGSRMPEIRYLCKVYTFAGCVLGHNYPFYMHFKGGKGVAVLAGEIIAFHPHFLPIQIVVFLLPVLLTQYVSLGSLIVYTGTLVQMILWSMRGAFAPQTAAVNREMIIVQAVMTGIAFLRHRENIKKLIAGTENKTDLFRKR